MPLLRLAFTPGIDKQNTEYGAEGGWIDSDYVRFRYGLPEKIGGWKYFAGERTAFLGAISDIKTWTDLEGRPRMIIGTTKKIYTYFGQTWYDITPIRKNSTGVTFTTVDESNVVVVNDPSHGAKEGDFVTFSDTSGNPGGIPNATLDAEYEIQEILSPDTYSILTPVNATANATAAGTADAEYQISIGPDVGYFGYGWGINTWGLLEWGTPRPATSTGVELSPRVWQFDTYGEYIICQQVDGSTYVYTGSPNAGSRATIISGAPTRSTFALVSTPDRHLICFGTETTIGDPNSQDKMFVRFSDQEDINTFYETATNTAGGQRLNDGEQIISAIRSRGQILIFTNTALHSMQYIGPPYTFGFQQLGANCGIAGPHSAIDVNGIAFWMGPDAFYAFDGTVKKIPCTVQDYVFKDINQIQRFKFNVGLNSQFNEVTWWYCSFTSEYIDRFVTYNYVENTWHIGTMKRSAWADTGIYRKPIAGEYLPNDEATPFPMVYGALKGRTLLYYQEDGFDNIDEPIRAYIQSGYFDIGDGDSMLFMRRFIPDFKNQRNNLTVNLLMRPYPQATASPSSTDPHIITPTTQKVDTRARGRQISLKIISDTQGSNWRFGTMRVDIQPDGLR